MSGSFVRRHRALVLAVAATASVLAIGAWVAVGRVLAARDEALARAHAAELARAREAERASDLVVSQARLLLATNPTGAVAMVRPLAATDRWREVRAVAAGARAAGVARRLPGPATVAWLDLSHGGTRAVVCGADGTIHVYDLAARTHEVVATLNGHVRATFVDDQRVLAWAGATFTLIDLATKRTTTYERPAAIAHVDARDGVAYFADAKRTGWRLDLATGQAFELPVGGPVAQVAISPDGKHVALAGEHLWLIETKHPELVEKIHDGKKFEIVWSANGEHLGAIGQHATYDITIHPEIEVGEYGITNQSIALARGTLYSTGLAGMTVGPRSIGEADLASSLAGLHVTRGELVVGATRTGLRVFDGDHELVIPLPAVPVSALHASPRSPYVLAVCADQLLVWNVDHVAPRRVAVPTYAQIAIVGPDRAWTITSGDTSQAVDVHTGETHPIAKLPPMRHAAPASGAFLVARPLANPEPWIVHADGKVDKLAIEAAHVTVVDARRVAIGTAQRELVVYAVDPRTTQRVASYGAAVERVIAREAAPRWIVVALDDGTLARHDLDTGRATETRIAPRSDTFSPGLAATAPTRTGDVFVATGARLRRWTLAGAVADHVAVPRPIHAVYLLDDERVLVIADDGTGYVARTDQPTVVRLPALGLGYAWSPRDPTLIVTDDRSGGVTVIDVVANAAWKIARATPPGMTPDISGDGTVVVMRDAGLDATAIALWNLDLPTTPAATAAWIEDLTNATFDPRTGMLGWPP